MKTENLLIGNGVNLNGSHLFTSKEIIKRIEKTMQFGIDFLSLQNNRNFLRDIKENFDFDNFSGNVEELLFECFKLVINKRNQYFKVLNEKCFLELLTLLKRIFINAIFVKNNQLINIEIPDVIVGKIKSYKRIFSTNYYEYWDNKNITTHLHGKISFTPFDKSEYSVEEEKIIYDIEYASAIDDLFIEKDHFPIENLEDIIMIPVGYKIDKNEISKLEKKYDQYGFMLLERIEVEEHKDIYHSLDNVNDITLYGISPKGDKLLVNKLVKIPVVVIFVYDMINNVEEVEIWKRCIPHAKLFDSKEFL